MTYRGYYCDVQRERRRNKRQSTYRRPKWSEYYEEKSLQLQIENYTCSIRLWMSYFMCDNKHTFGKQMPPDLAMLLAFLIETVDWLDNKTEQCPWYIYSGECLSCTEFLVGLGASGELTTEEWCGQFYARKVDQKGENCARWPVSL